MTNASRIDMLLNILVNEPEDVFTNYALAIEYQALGEYEKAQKQFIKVTELNKSYLPSYYQLGQVSEKLNKRAEALSYYNKGLEIAKEQNNQKAINEINEAIWMLED